MGFGVLNLVMSGVASKGRIPPFSLLYQGTVECVNILSGKSFPRFCLVINKEKLISLFSF